MDALATLRRLRRAGLDSAQRELVRCLAAETRAQAAMADLDRSIACETEAATALAGDDARVEAFGAWLREARRRSNSLRAALEERQAETHRCRAALTACRTALETVEALQHERATAAVADKGRLDHHERDDTTRQVAERNLR